MAADHRILVMDDEVNMRELLEIVLENDGYTVQSEEDVDGAIATLEKQQFDAVLTDLRVGADREAGMRLLSWITENAPHTPAIMITAHGSVESAIEAMKRGAADYISKPFKNDEIRLVVQRAIGERDLRRENLALRQAQSRLGRLEDIIGESQAMENLLDMIRRVAALPSTVAIHGESGTGKELVARAIHELSDRSQRPFVAVNCGGIPENLLESELFGHKKGAFTSAVEDKEGLFVTADGGTLFLDEIGEMPMPLQVKLLRVLSDSIVQPVGGTSGVKVDVRLVSATNRDLKKMTADGTFREDLFYRLNVIPIHVPPLRERPEDVPALARHFVRKYGAKLGRADMTISPEAIVLLQKYRWPGNVRELENVMERIMALCAHNHIEINDLPYDLRGESAPVARSPESPAPAASSSSISELPPEGVDLEALIASVEMELIGQALERAKHSQKRAAKLLGLTPRSLRYRLQKYEIDSG